MSVWLTVMLWLPLRMLVAWKLQTPELLALTLPSTVAVPPTVSVISTVAPASAVPVSTGWAMKTACVELAKVTPNVAGVPTVCDQFTVGSSLSAGSSVVLMSVVEVSTAMSFKRVASDALRGTTVIESMATAESKSICTQASAAAPLL